mgnify:CR=1 FL=1
MSEIIVKGHTIRHSNYAEYKFSDLPEKLCQEICEVEDKGKQWSEDSRYTWSCGELKDKDGIMFGTAKAVVQSLIMSKFNVPFKRFSITKNINDE